MLTVEHAVQTCIQQGARKITGKLQSNCNISPFLMHKVPWERVLLIATYLQLRLEKVWGGGAGNGCGGVGDVCGRIFHAEPRFPSISI
jgi:hypothetical protein